jgi:hypothetical protein
MYAPGQIKQREVSFLCALNYPNVSHADIDTNPGPVAREYKGTASSLAFARRRWTGPDVNL